MNINDNVYVVLTPLGKRIATAHGFDAIITNNRTCWQLWSLMAVFGSYLFPGCDPLFENNEIYFSGETGKGDQCLYLPA